MKIQFRAMDYTAEDTFQEAEYEFEGSLETGWSILRNGSPYLTLGPGYKLLKTVTCGVCSTDLDRRFLPFPLPQVIGHELVAQDIPESPDQIPDQYVVEINDTFVARGDHEVDSFCKVGLPTHSPERRVLGIDRLPGGFGPYILAPQHAAIPFSGLSPKVAVLTEPFAAALQAVTSSIPKAGSEVAVLGPRRLGSLVLAALVALRNSRSLDFKITAIVRHSHLVQLAQEIGADEVIDLRNTNIDSLANRFSIVYDTTSTPSGFLSALKIAKEEVHLKTTNGQVMGGISHLTELVVDELSLVPYSLENLQFHWKNEKRQNRTAYLSPTVPEALRTTLGSSFEIFQGTNQSAYQFLKNKNQNGEFPRFDIAIVTNPEEIAGTIRPETGSEDSLVRPRGAILVSPQNRENWKEDSFPIFDFFSQGKSIRSSRCGDFPLALELLKANPQVASALETHMISHEFTSNNLEKAYTQARSPESVKVLVHHGAIS